MLLMVLGPSLHLTHPLGPDMHAPSARLAEGGVPGPYHLATMVAPLLRYFRAPYRWMTPAHIALAVVVACGFAGLRSRLAPGRLRRMVTVLLLAAVPLLATLDVRGLRAPLVDARIPIAGHLLQADPEPAAVLELPSGLGRSFGLMSSRWMFHQTAHGKYLLEGTVARLPAGHQPVVERTIRSFEDLPFVKYVVIHRDALLGVLPESRRQVAEIEAILEREGERITPPGRTEIHRLRTFRPTTVRPRP